MKALLICPAARENVAAFAQASPLSNLRLLGGSLVEHWLGHLAVLGANEVLILASDRPEQVRTLTGDGARWGLRAEVVPQIRELTPAAARAKYRAGQDEAWLPAPDDATSMDHLPRAPRFPLFASYAGAFAAVQNWLLQAVTAPDRVGVREFKPGVWVGLGARISPKAELRAPCWVGENVFVGAQTTIGPDAILESDSFVECGAKIERSLIGAETLVGEFTEICDSIALGSILVNWRLDSTVEVPDEFLLCSLHHPLAAARGAQRRWPQLWNVGRAAYSLITGAPYSPARRRLEPSYAPQARGPRAALK